MLLVLIAVLVLLSLLVGAAVWAYRWMCVFPCPQPAPGSVPAAPELRERLERHVRSLCELGPRHADRPAAMAKTQAYIKGHLTSAGLTVGEHAVAFPGAGGPVLWADLGGSVPGADLVVAGAHYDSVVGSPGADDNASSVAALLELARLLPARRRTLRLAFFSDEEDPFFETDRMGSQAYAAALRARGERLHAMVSLDAIGYYSDVPGSQKYPTGLALLFPTTGNFISVVADPANRDLVRRFHGYLARETDLPVLGTATFAAVEGIDWSDHRAFWQHGYAALMVTDTAANRNPHVHTPGDRPETLDFDRLTRLTAALAKALAALANE